MAGNDGLFRGSVSLNLQNLAQEASSLLQQKRLCCVVAESCTGGSLAALLTSFPGSSQWFERGFITYSNLAKTEILGIPEHKIAAAGAVSQEIAQAMAIGALKASHAQVSIAITGIAGPTGGSTEKPVGTVWIAWAGIQDAIHSEHYIFQGNRDLIRQQAVEAALQGLLKYLQQKNKG